MATGPIGEYVQLLFLDTVFHVAGYNTVGHKALVADRRTWPDALALALQATARRRLSHFDSTSHAPRLELHLKASVYAAPVFTAGDHGIFTGQRQADVLGHLVAVGAAYKTSVYAVIVVGGHSEARSLNHGIYIFIVGVTRSAATAHLNRRAGVHSIGQRQL